MDDAADLTADLSQYQTNIQVPIIHEQPQTTLESLSQLQNEFSKRVQESNDAGKKRRYQRQLKQVEDAIKATREGKSYNYSEVVIPPGFAKIPLDRDGKPILGNSGNKAMPPTSSNNRPSPNKPVVINHEHSNENVDDDLIKCLEAEIDDNEDLNDIEPDPEEEHINKLINAASKHVKPLSKAQQIKKHEEEDLEFYDNELESQVEALRIPKSQPKQLVPSPKRNSAMPMVSVPTIPVKQQRQEIAGASVKKVQTKELTIILERQRLFKEAALKAKQEGNTKVALVYLRHAKGFEQMIMAAENGLPLDMNNLPVPPQLEMHLPKVGRTSVVTSSTNVVVIKASDEPPIQGDRKTVYKRLQDDLVEQIKIATANFKHFTSMGDVNNANKFNQIARESIQDLESLKNAFGHGQSLPLYHYEKRSYQTIDCNSDLTDNDLELFIIRAINLPLPKDFTAKDLTTYVKFEFPYPPEQAQADKTNKQSGTLNPEYNQTFKLQIQRKHSKFQRLMNRKELKLEIFYKAGLLKSDKLLATCLVKLQPLENESTIHDAFDLIEGRKQTGGKLEIKIRIREPILHKEVKVLEHKWLIIDKFNVQSAAM